MVSLLELPSVFPHFLPSMPPSLLLPVPHSAARPQATSGADLTGSKEEMAGSQLGDNSEHFGCHCVRICRHSLPAEGPLMALATSSP